MGPKLTLSIKDIRNNFFTYFQSEQHLLLSSNPVILVYDCNSPLLHNALRRINLASGSASKRTTFSLKCIRALSDANDIGRFGDDNSFHDLTELLSTWSSGDNCKEESIKFCWTLLTEKYKLPKNRIYVTYHGGSSCSGLIPDTESRDMWKKYLPNKRVLSSTRKDDYWTYGEAGPCGHCSCIFYDTIGNRDASVSILNDPTFIEIWRFVFVEFNKGANGSVQALAEKHAISSMSIECVASLLQNKSSHYELDTFSNLIEAIKYCADKAKDYSGKVGAAGCSDTAYRIVADHLRVITSVNSEESQFPKEGREHFLRRMDTRAIKAGHQVLGTNKERYSILLNVALRHLGCSGSDAQIDDIIKQEDKIYEKRLAESQIPVKKKKRKKSKDDTSSEKTEATSSEKTEVTSSEKTEATSSEKTEATSSIVVKRYLDADVKLKTRVIEFLGRRTNVILKERDRPCALVSICNALLLREKIKLDGPEVSVGHLIYLVERCLLCSMQMQLQSNLKYSSIQKQVLGEVKNLQYFLYLDVTFDRIDGFLVSPQSLLLKYLGVPLYHGWLVDPMDKNLNPALLANSYFEHSVQVAKYETLQESTGICESFEKEVKSFAKEAMRTLSCSGLDLASLDTIAQFLRGPQITPYGVSCLIQNLNENEPCLLILKDRFIITTKNEGSLYFLVNGPDLLRFDTNVVWEGLKMNGERTFFDCNFVSTNQGGIQPTLPLTKSELKKMTRNLEEQQIHSKLSSSMEKDQQGIVDPTTTSVTVEDAEFGCASVCKEVGSTSGSLDPQQASTATETYVIRYIDFFYRKIPVIIQHKDGPCPFIAICNVLILNGSIRLEAGISMISESSLIVHVKSYLERTKKVQLEKNEEVLRDLNDVIASLLHGLDVDIVFNRIDGFTHTKELMLFDYLDILLYHGWLLDSKSFEGEVHEWSFETLSWAVKEPDLPNVEMLKEFLNGPQVTASGLSHLNEELREHVPCILYLYNHFSTIIKINGVIYSLATNECYLETDVVWQVLDVGNTGEFVDSSFTPINLQQRRILGSHLKPREEQEGNLITLSDQESDLMTVSSHLKPRQEQESNMMTLSANQEGDMMTVSNEPVNLRCGFRTSPSSGYGIPCYTLEEFVAGVPFSELRKLFPSGTSRDVADTTAYGRFIARDLLDVILYGHAASRSWNGQFDLSSIMLIDYSYVEIWAPECEDFTEAARMNDIESYIRHIFPLFECDNVGLPACFAHLKTLLEGFSKAGDMTEIELTHLRMEASYHPALRSSMSRTGFFSGTHRIRRLGCGDVRSRLRIALTSREANDWRSIAQSAHPVLARTLRYIEGADNSVYLHDNAFGSYTNDLDSFTIFPRQVNEHGKPKPEDLLPGEVLEEYDRLSDFELLTSNSLGGEVADSVGAIVTSDLGTRLDNQMQEVLEEYNRKENIRPSR